MPPVETVVVNLPAARLADFAICLGPLDVIFQGASTVLIKGLPAARKGDLSVHGGVISAGASTVLIGGPTFSLPSNITVEGNATFQNKVIRDLYFLSTTTTGQEILRRLGSTNQPVIIRETTGTNNSCTGNSGTAQHSGNPTGSVILYNPDYRSNGYDDQNNLIPLPGQVILAHEMVHALDNAEGHYDTGADPNGPASEPNIDLEESQAIGTGSHDGAAPTENSLRDDLNLDRRDNHFGTGGPAAGEPAPVQLRPGGY